MKTTSSFSFKRLAVTAAFALALPLGAAAFDGSPGPGGCGGMGGGPGFGHPGMGMGGMGMGMGGGGWSHQGLQRLNLTEAQRDRVFDITHTNAPVMRDNMKAMQKARADLQALVMSPDYSDAKVKELADAVAAASSKMALDRIKMERQVYDVLTPDQRQKLAEMKNECQERQPKRGDGPRRKAGKVPPRSGA